MSAGPVPPIWPNGEGSRQRWSRKARPCRSVRRHRLRVAARAAIRFNKADPRPVRLANAGIGVCHIGARRRRDHLTQRRPCSRAKRCMSTRLTSRLRVSRTPRLPNRRRYGRMRCRPPSSTSWSTRQVTTMLPPFLSLSERCLWTPRRAAALRRPRRTPPQGRSHLPTP